MECARSLCDEVGRLVDVDCIVNDDGETARVEYHNGEEDAEEVDGAQARDIYIDIPETCHAAVRETFGSDWLEGDEETGVSLIMIQRQERNHHNKAIVTLLPQCAVSTSTTTLIITQDEVDLILDDPSLDIDAADWTDFYDYQYSLNLIDYMNPQHVVPGHRERHVLKYLFCPEEFPEGLQSNGLQVAQVVYEVVLKYRHALVTLVVHLFAFVSVAVDVIGLMFQLILPTLVLKRFAKFPDAVTKWNIWRTLLLLCLVSDPYTTCPLLSTLLTVRALWYGNTTAAMEWSFLGVLAWGAPDVGPYLDSLFGGILAKLDGLGILGWVLDLLVVGVGWWKLVTIYVVGRSYQSLVQSQRPRDALEETQVSMTQQQHHDKVD